MAFNKIQPQQLQLPTFFSESGNLLFTNNSTGMTVELNANITGPVDFNNGLTIENGKQLVTSSDGTTIQGTGNAAVGNSGSLTLSGMYNSVVGGTTSSMKGEYNVFINNHGLSLGLNTTANTVVGGDVVIIDDAITGSVGLFSNSFTERFDRNETVYIGGLSGIRFASSGLFESDVLFDTDVYVKEDATVSGDLHVSGETRLTGALNVGARAYLNSLFVENVSTFGEIADFEVGFTSQDTAHFAAQMYSSDGITASGDSIFSGSTTMLGETIISGTDRLVISGAGTEIYGDVAFAGGTVTVGGNPLMSIAEVGDFVTGGGTAGTDFLVSTYPTASALASWFSTNPYVPYTDGRILFNMSGYRFEISGHWYIDDAKHDNAGNLIYV